MYYGLKESTRIRKEKACTAIFSVWETSHLKYTHPMQAVVMALCDGQRSKDDMTQVMSQAFSISHTKAGALVDQSLKELHEYVDAAPAPFTLKKQRYDPVRFVYRPDGDPNLGRLSGPVEVAWMVTYRCPFDCVYCCVPTVSMSTPQPGELTTEQAFAFLEDCARTGIEHVIIHGGEPFIREDLPELLKFLIDHDIHFIASTKLPLKEKVVARLAEIGLEELQLSIDSTDSDTADRMVARPHFLKGFWHNVDLMLRYGIRPRANIVVTGLNCTHIPTLIRDVRARGVTKVTMNAYLRSPHKHHDSFFAGKEALVRLANEIKQLAREFPEMELQMPGTMSARETSLCMDGLSACPGGRTGVAIGGDGSVSFCDRLIGHQEAIVGNIKTQSLLDIWYGYELKEFVDPSPAKFEGTACGSCGMMSACNKRMRCYYRAQIVDNRLYGPDYLCHNTPEPKERFF